MNTNIQTLTVGKATAKIINGTVHILKRSSSRFHLSVGPERMQYCCQDGCCDRGLQPDVASLVEQAKELGATKVVIRTGQRGYFHPMIAGLPVQDVSGCVGEIDVGVCIERAW